MVDNNENVLGQKVKKSSDLGNWSSNFMPLGGSKVLPLGGVSVASIF